MVQLHYAHSADESHGVRISPQCPWRVVGGDKQGVCSNETANTEVPCHSRKALLRTPPPLKGRKHGANAYIL